jgi:hypothetical protein
MTTNTHERSCTATDRPDTRLCDRVPLTATEVLGHRGPATGIATPFVFPARTAFTGVLGVGKDYIAKKHGFEILGFADPIYTLARRYLGTDDKSVPGVRKFQQDVGQWGRGLVTAEQPMTTERHRITTEIREEGVSIPGEGVFDASDYGLNPEFWVNIMLSRIRRRFRSASIAVTNCRFANELAALTSVGFRTYHVTCSPETLSERREAAGYKDPTVFNNISEQLALEFDRRFRADELVAPRVDVIWNDYRPVPAVLNSQVLVNP